MRTSRFLLSLIILGAQAVGVGAMGDEFVHQNLGGILSPDAYLIGSQDFESDESSCSSLSGSVSYCRLQRSVTQQPYYIGLGMNLARALGGEFSVQADMDSGIHGKNPLVPGMDESRGLTLSGQLRLDAF